MKRYVCTVAAGLLLALASSGTAGASLPLPGLDQTGAQLTSFGDQTVGEQRNHTDVSQLQGNGNVNISPAIAIGGDASTENTQGNGNSADARVEQDNAASQSQSSDRTQSQYQRASNGNCCDGQSQTGEQKIDFGDQTVEKQRNDADVTQKQGNGNVNVSPAIAFGGKQQSCASKCRDSWGRYGGNASTWNAQGNGNAASASVDQSNTVEQLQWAGQRQSLAQACKEVILR